MYMLTILPGGSPIAPPNQYLGHHLDKLQQPSWPLLPMLPMCRFIGGLGFNYQRADGITLAPIRAGLGFRLGANIGYLSYARKRHWFPF